MTPRRQLTSSPFSIQSLSATTANGLSAACVACVTSAQINSVDGAKVTGTVANATNATNATNAANATTANSANTANTATTAGNVTGVVAIANGGTGSATQNFVDLTTAQTVAGAKTFSDNLRVNGLIRVGSETGTTDAPTVYDSNGNNIYAGLVVSRINSLDSSAGNIAARTNYLRLERDGTNGGWRIANDALPASERQTVHCLGITGSSTILTARVTLPNGTAAGTNQLFTNAQNIEYMQCSFGNTANARHLTQVTVQRYPGDYYWVGTVTSTFNQ